MSDLSVFSQHADQEVAQFEAHKRIYSAKNPPPEKPNIRAGDIWLQFAGLSILNISAMIVSAPHTIPLFLESVADQEIIWGINVRHIVGVAAFIMIEIALILLTYIRIRQRSRSREEWQEGVDGSNKWVQFAFNMVLTVALCANIYSTINPSFEDSINPLNDNTPDSVAQLRAAAKIETVDDKNLLEQAGGFALDGLRLIIFLLIGASAPILLFLTGEASAIIWVQRSSAFKTEKAEYDRRYATWNDQCIAAYRPAKYRTLSTVGYGASTVHDAIDNNRQTSVQNNRHENGNRRMDAGKIILDHLAENPADVDAPVRDLGRRLNIPPATVSKYQRIHKANMQ